MSIRELMNLTEVLKFLHLSHPVYVYARKLRLFPQPDFGEGRSERWKSSNIEEYENICKRLWIIRPAGEVPFPLCDLPIEERLFFSAINSVIQVLAKHGNSPYFEWGMSDPINTQVHWVEDGNQAKCLDVITHVRKRSGGRTYYDSVTGASSSKYVRKLAEGEGREIWGRIVRLVKGT